MGNFKSFPFFLFDFFKKIYYNIYIKRKEMIIMNKIFYIDFAYDVLSIINEINDFLSIRSTYEIKSITAIQPSCNQNANGRYGALVVVGPC